MAGTDPRKRTTPPGKSGGRRGRFACRGRLGPAHFGAAGVAPPAAGPSAIDRPLVDPDGPGALGYAGSPAADAPPTPVRVGPEGSMVVSPRHASCKRIDFESRKELGLSTREGPCAGPGNRLPGGRDDA